MIFEVQNLGNINHAKIDLSKNLILFTHAVARFYRVTTIEQPLADDTLYQQPQIVF